MTFSIVWVQGTKISGRGCLAILRSCERLEWLEHCPFNCDSDIQIFKSRQEIFDLIKKVRHAGFSHVRLS
jgi:hypothetical protein